MTDALDRLINHDELAHHLRVHPDELRWMATDPTWGPQRLTSPTGDVVTFSSMLDAWIASIRNTDGYEQRDGKTVCPECRKLVPSDRFGKHMVDHEDNAAPLPRLARIGLN